MEIGTGWFGVVSRMLDRLRDFQCDVEINELRENHGQLAVGLARPADDVAMTIINQAIEESARTCDTCGGDSMHHSDCPKFSPEFPKDQT
jgi:hypothetical protein